MSPIHSIIPPYAIFAEMFIAVIPKATKFNNINEEKTTW
jgi:hypothetical protein